LFNGSCGRSVARSAATGASADVRRPIVARRPGIRASARP